MITQENPYQTPEGDLIQNNYSHAEVKLFGFKGRIDRTRFLAHIAIHIIPLLVLLWIGIIIIDEIPYQSAFRPHLQATVAIVLFSLTPLSMISICMQRLHDINLNGMFAPVVFVPICGIIFLLYILFMPGTRGKNNFGEPQVTNRFEFKFLAFSFGLILFGLYCMLNFALAMGLYFSLFDTHQFPIK